MGYLYQITYPHAAGCDAVHGDHLDTIAARFGDHELAVAENTNWDRHVLYHWEHAWLSPSALPERASFAYRAGPAWGRAESARLTRESRTERANAAALIAAIRPVTMTAGEMVLTLAVDADGTLLVTGSPHVERQAVAAYLGAPAEWRAEVEGARHAVVVADRKADAARRLVA